MIRFHERAPRHAVSDSATIPLINVVFLMLIFLLVAGTLRQFQDDGIVPPDAVRDAVSGVDPQRVVRLFADGRLVYNDADMPAEAIAAALASLPDDTDGTGETEVWLLADRELDAARGVEALRALQAEGLRNVRLIVSLGDDT